MDPESDFIQIEGLNEEGLEIKPVEKPTEETPPAPSSDPENAAEKKESVTENALEEKVSAPSQQEKEKENPPAKPVGEEEEEIDTRLGNDTPDDPGTPAAESEEELQVSETETKRRNQELEIENSALERKIKTVEALLNEATATISNLEAVVKRYLPYLDGRENVIVKVKGEDGVEREQPLAVNKIISDADSQTIAGAAGFTAKKQQATYQAARVDADAKLSKTLGKVAFELKNDGVPIASIKGAILGFQRSYNKDQQFAAEWLKKVAFYDDEDLAFRVKSEIKKSAAEKAAKTEESELEKLRRENAELKAKADKKEETTKKPGEEKKDSPAAAEGVDDAEGLLL
jgi:hypothetical protein